MMLGPRILSLILLSFIYTNALAVSVKVHTIAVGQGDAHIIECKTPAGKGYNYDYAIVDMGTSSIKDKRTLERIQKDILKGQKVSNIFLTHPDVDHYNYISQFVNDPKMNKNKIKIHFGGSLEELWASGPTSLDFLNKIPQHPPIFYEPDDFITGTEKNWKRNSKYVPLCNGKLQMEIIFGGWSSKNVKVNENDKENDDKMKNEKSLVMKLSGQGLKSMLFMGDFVGYNALDILSKLANNEMGLLKADVWVLPHHGSNLIERTSPKPNLPTPQQIYKDLAQAVGAKEIVISSDIKGSFAHPRCDTIKNLFYYPLSNINNINLNQLCTPTAPQNTQDYVQCWTHIAGQGFLYTPEFCKCNIVQNGQVKIPKIRQTTKEDTNGNVIWNDVVTIL